MRSNLYALARLLGWANAIVRGPAALARRIGRVALMRAIFRGMR